MLQQLRSLAAKLGSIPGTEMVAQISPGIQHCLLTFQGTRHTQGEHTYSKAKYSYMYGK